MGSDVTDLAIPSSALAIGAHPDDVEFGCGATLAKWAAAGCVINHLILTDGSKGTWRNDQDLVELVALREVEQRAAADALGSTGEVVMLGLVDGELESSLAVRDQVAYWIRKLTPDVVLGHDPWRRYRLHPDHRHAGWLTVDGVVAARDPHFFTHHDVEHHRPDVLLLFEADEPDHIENVTGFAEQKIDALLAHRSQFHTTMHIDDDDQGEQLEAFRAHVLEVLHDAGTEIGVEHGERFKRIDRL